MFTEHLKPVNNKKTVYVFCSFVDGVGKSTMLGNIKNWLRYGDNIDRFEHVDNSSSQFAELFAFDDNVYIADLPAQMSHIVYKPDGYVYVDARTVYKETELESVKEFILTHGDELKKNYENLVNSVQATIKQEGYFAQSLEDKQNPAALFVKNLLLLKREKDNKWLPLTHDGIHYLVDSADNTKIRSLITLAQVKSEGLKNIESEQMLFVDGLRFPLPYDLFLLNLSDQLKAHSIEEVVFVDFMSMYPRSSRENIRVNYIIQQLALLYENFDPHNSMYRYFSSGEELLYCLQDDKKKAAFFASMKVEVLLRLMLYNMICLQENKSIEASNFSLHELTEKLKKEEKEITGSLHAFIEQHLTRKMIYEMNYLERIYGSTKSFVNVQTFSFERASKLFKALADFFTENLEHDRLSVLWSSPGVLSDSDTSKKHEKGTVLLTDSGQQVTELFFLHEDCRGSELHPFLKTLRSRWYGAVGNLLWAQQMSEGRWRLDYEEFRLNPCLLVQEHDGYYRVIQRVLERCEGDGRAFTASDIVLMVQLQLAQRGIFGSFGGQAYRLNGEALTTGTRFYAYGHEGIHLDDEQRFIPLPHISQVIQKFQRKYGVNSVMPVADVVEQLKKNTYWQREQNNQRLRAQQNGMNKQRTGPGVQKIAQKNAYGIPPEKPLFVGSVEQRKVAQLVVRMLATIDMIVKDPDADIAVRYGNRDDFKAAVWLLEKTTLPKYFKIVFLEDLFDDYDAVEPFPSWDYWEHS